MAEKLLTTTRTTPTATDFTKAMMAIWPEATKAQVGVLYAHFAGETNDGVSCWNWNLGNVKHVAGDGFDYVSLRGVWEGFVIKDEDKDGDIDADDKAMLIARLLRSGMWQLDDSKDHAIAVGPTKVSMIASPNNSATWFRAYPSLAVGMEKYLGQKRNPGGRYYSAWQYVLAGNPEEYGRELGRKGYYTASQDAYAKSMRRKFDAWMKMTAYEQVMEEAVPTPMVIAAPVAEIVLPNTDNMMLQAVELDGETWLVCPVQIAPMAIGDALTVANALGFTLPSPALVDAIWRQADLKVPPHLMIRSHDGVHMDTPELHAKQSAAIAAYVGDRGLGRDFHLVAGAFKDIVLVDGKLGIYGWHVSAEEEAELRRKFPGLPLYAPSTPGPGKVIQQANTKAHGPTWRDYSQAYRLARRA